MAPTRADLIKFAEFVLSGATSLAVNQGVGSVSGTSVVASPNSTTTYTLTASNASGSHQRDNDANAVQYGPWPVPMSA